MEVFNMREHNLNESTNARLRGHTIYIIIIWSISHTIQSLQESLLTSESRRAARADNMQQRNKYTCAHVSTETWRHIICMRSANIVGICLYLRVSHIEIPKKGMKIGVESKLRGGRQGPWLQINRYSSRRWYKQMNSVWSLLTKNPLCITCYIAYKPW
jgi:hypothetical protein